MSESELRI